MSARGLAVVASLACAVALVLAASPAAGRIVVQKGIAGVRIGMSKPRVRAVLGKPRAVLTKKNNFGWYNEYRYPGLFVRFQGRRKVTAVTTSRRGERTPGGLGVGSPKRAVIAKLGRSHCRFLFGADYCYLGTLRPGTRATVFHFSASRVSRVSVGLVVD